MRSWWCSDDLIESETLMTMINPVTLALVRSALDAGVMRQVAHANNLANVNTVGYRPFQVVFEEGLDAVREAVAEGRADNLASQALPAAQWVQLEAGTPVSLDSEVAAMTQNGLQYQALTKALGRHYALLSLAVSDGRR